MEKVYYKWLVILSNNVQAGVKREVANRIYFQHVEMSKYKAKSLQLVVNWIYLHHQCYVFGLRLFIYSWVHRGYFWRTG